MKNDWKAGISLILASIYIVFLIPKLIPVSSNQLNSVALTAIVCAALTLGFALVTRLPYMVGPGIVPASICAAFLVAGVPWATVLGICVIAGLTFTVLAATGIVNMSVKQMPVQMKLAIQFSIGVYLLAAALRAGGFAPQSGSLQMTAVGAVFLCGIAVTFALDFQRGTKGYAILVGIVAATAVAFLTNQVAMPSSIFAVPQFTGFTAPDISAAFAREHVVRILIMLYVLVVDVVATLETVSDNCKALQNKDGTPLNFKRGLFFSGVTSTLGPLLGICPFIPLFETLAGVFSGGTTWRVSAVAATGFIVTVVMTPIAAIVPAAASAVALAFIGLSISKVAWKTFESEEMSGRYDRVIRYLLVGSVIGVLYVGSIAVAVLLTAAIYPIAMLKSKQSPRPSDWIVAVVCLALLSLN